MSVFIIWVMRKKLSDLLLDVSGRYKHLDENYDNVLGFGKVRASRRKMNLLSYSNVLIGCLNTILIKDSLFFIVMKTI